MMSCEITLDPPPSVVGLVSIEGEKCRRRNSFGHERLTKGPNTGRFHLRIRGVTFGGLALPLGKGAADNDGAG